MMEYGNDRYVWQTQRQNMGLTCSDCGSHQGHFSICPLFHKGLPSDSVSMEYVLGIDDKPQPDSQSFYRKAQAEIEDRRKETVKQTMLAAGYGWSQERGTWKLKDDKPIELVITNEDVIRAKGLGIKL